MQPDGWVKKSNKWICLRCQRERVMDRAASGREPTAGPPAARR